VQDLRPEPEKGAGAVAREMLGLLRRQAGLYEQLEALSRQQQAQVAAEDTQPLLRTLAQRQRLTQELQTLAGGLAPMRQNWDRLRAALPECERETADALVREAKARLGRLLAADEEDARRLRIRKQHTGDALRAVHASRQAVAAYGGGANTTSGRLDRTHADA